MQPTILIAESRRFPEAAAELLRAHGRLVLADLDLPGLRQEIATAEVLWVRLRHRIDAELMELAPRLRLIASPTTGLNHIDLDLAQQRGIEVVSLRGRVDFLKDIRATAEHTLGLMLALLRRLPSAANHVLEGGWDRDQFLGGELHGKVVGIVGYGRLGKIVARYLQAFDAHVIAADPHVTPECVPDSIPLVSLEELLELR